MSKFTNASRKINAIHGAKKLKDKIEVIKNSNLSAEEKDKALKSYDKMLKVTIVVTLLVTIVMAIALLIGFGIDTKVGSIVGMICIIVAPIILVLYALLARNGKIFSDWIIAYNKIQDDFDGLTKEEIDLLKPNDKELLLIKEYKKKSFITALLFLVSLVLEIVILLSLHIAVNSFITIIITFIIVIIWYIFEDTYEVEINRIKSGYYKKSYGFYCQKCGSLVDIKFSELEKYDSLPKDKDGVRTINCHTCGNPVGIYNFDTALKDYKKYLEKIK